MYFFCGFCDKKFLKKANLKAHELAQHEGDGLFYCQVAGCNKSFEKITNYQTHARYVHSGNQRCEQCGKVVSNLWILKHHKQTVHSHSNIRPICDTCGVEFDTKYIIKMHFKATNPHKPMQCLICQEVVLGRAALFAHQKSEHDALETCDRCGKKFSRVISLVKHQKRCVSTAFTLPEAPSPTPAQKEWNQALEKAKKEDEAETAIIASKIKEMLPSMRCPACEMTFPDSFLLKIHLNFSLACFKVVADDLKEREPSQPLEQVGMTPDVIQKLQDKATVLTQERKKKKKAKYVPPCLASADEIRGFLTVDTHSHLHQTGRLFLPGILALDISSDDSKIITGGNDKNATIFDKDHAKVVTILKGHTKKVTKVIYHPDESIVVTASPDSTIRVWNVPTSQTTLLLRCHEGPVTGLSLHPTGDFILSTSKDKYWAFSDIRTGRLLTKNLDTSERGLTAAQFHPDGALFGTGTEDAQVRIWDLKEQTNVANFTGHVGEISSIAFSENGYQLVTASADEPCVKLWDLRKPTNAADKIQLDDGYEVKDLCFDQSGTYLAIAGTDIRIGETKQWSKLRVFNDHSAVATGVRFGRHAQWLASTSMDRTLKVYGIE